MGDRVYHWMVVVENIWDEYQNEDKYLVHATSIDSIMTWARENKKVVISATRLDVNDEVTVL